MNCAEVLPFLFRFYISSVMLSILNKHDELGTISFNITNRGIMMIIREITCMMLFNAPPIYIKCLIGLVVSMICRNLSSYTPKLDLVCRDISRKYVLPICESHSNMLACIVLNLRRFVRGEHISVRNFVNKRIHTHNSICF
jgi:hypothetical protein